KPRSSTRRARAASAGIGTSTSAASPNDGDPEPIRRAYRRLSRDTQSSTVWRETPAAVSACQEERAMGAWELLTSLEQKVPPSRAAVVVVDVQNDFFHDDGYLGKLGAPLDAIQAMVPKLEQL